MNEYILFMHDDVLQSSIANDEGRWGQYVEQLRDSGQFDGGSTIGQGKTFRKGCATQSAAGTVRGYIRVRAESIEAASLFLSGNPIFEAGGTVEIRELPRT